MKKLERNMAYERVTKLVKNLLASSSSEDDLVPNKEVDKYATEAKLKSAIAVKEELKSFAQAKALKKSHRSMLELRSRSSSNIAEDSLSVSSLRDDYRHKAGQSAVFYATLDTEAFTSSASLRSNSPTSSKSDSSGNKRKDAEQTAAAADATVATMPAPEKEKTHKDVSSSRIKKFHQHFPQVSKDEKLLNYYSCALVRDILLQGHLYITEQHFAFYSNVFGYVTKLVIPTNSVEKLSKEKTAKFIPNAVGVTTTDGRHVFGSFLSRDAAYKLMCNVCQTQLEISLNTTTAGSIENEELSIGDDSSCSISATESAPQAPSPAGKGQTLLRRSGVSASLNAISDNKHTAVVADNNKQHQHKGRPASVNNPAPSECNSVDLGSSFSAAAHITTTTTTPNNTSTLSSPLAAIMAPSANTIAPPASLLDDDMQTVGQPAVSSFKRFCFRLTFPRDLNVVYLGVWLSLLMALISLYLLYKILNIEAKTISFQQSTDFNLRSTGDDEQLLAQNTEDAIQQIAKVRRILQSLSTLINNGGTEYRGSD